MNSLTSDRYSLRMMVQNATEFSHASSHGAVIHSVCAFSACVATQSPTCSRLQYVCNIQGAASFCMQPWRCLKLELSPQDHLARSPCKILQGHSHKGTACATGAKLNPSPDALIQWSAFPTHLATPVLAAAAPPNGRHMERYSMQCLAQRKRVSVALCDCAEWCAAVLAKPGAALL